MADLEKSYVEVHFRRLGDGEIKISVKMDPELENSFKEHCGGATDSFGFPARYYQVSHDFRDSKLSKALFMVGASEDGGKSVTIRVPRSKNQLQDLCSRMQRFLRDWYDTNLKPYDITLSLRIRDSRQELRMLK